MRTVTMELRKWPAAAHRSVAGMLLGEDRYGVWIGIPAGTVVQLANGASRRESSPYVFVLPRNEWWCGRHFPDGGWKLDIATPCRWEDGRATAVDLDLDVRRMGDAVWIEDEAEFDDNVRRGKLPTRVVRPAREATVRLTEALRLDREPFATVGDQWLALLDEQPAH